MAIQRAFNISMTPRQGPCGGRHASLDGSCNDDNNRGSVLDSYSRIGTGFFDISLIFEFINQTTYLSTNRII